MKVEPTNNTRVLTDNVLSLFRKKYDSGAVRNVAVSYSNFVDDFIQVISLFDDVEKIDKEERFQTAIDTIRNQFWFTTIQKGNSLLEASRSLERSKLIGGHSAGGLDGLKWLIEVISPSSQQGNIKIGEWWNGWASSFQNIQSHWQMIRIRLNE